MLARRQRRTELSNRAAALSARRYSFHREPLEIVSQQPPAPPLQRKGGAAPPPNIEVAVTSAPTLRPSSTRNVTFAASVAGGDTTASGEGEEEAEPKLVMRSKSQTVPQAGSYIARHSASKALSMSTGVDDRLGNKHVTTTPLTSLPCVWPSCIEWPPERPRPACTCASLCATGTMDQATRESCQLKGRGKGGYTTWARQCIRHDIVNPPPNRCTPAPPRLLAKPWPACTMTAATCLVRATEAPTWSASPLCASWYDAERTKSVTQAPPLIPLPFSPLRPTSGPRPSTAWRRLGTATTPSTAWCSCKQATW